MRLKSYLLEDRSIPVSTDAIHDFLSKDYSEAYTSFKKGDKIYRGRKFSQKALITDPSKSYERGSPYTTMNLNYYTLLFNNLPSWKKYPKRAIICTTNSRDAYGRGKCYVVFPKNGAKIGICSSNDIWFSFEDELGGISLDTFNRYLYGLLRYINMGRSDGKWKEFIDACIVIDKNKEEIQERWNIPSWMDDYFGKDTPFIKYLDNLLSPENNKFKLVKISQFSAYKNKEVWTDSKCLLIDNDIIDALDLP